MHVCILKQQCTYKQNNTQHSSMCTWWCVIIKECIQSYIIVLFIRLCEICPNLVLLPTKHDMHMYKQFSCCCCRSENTPTLWILASQKRRPSMSWANHSWMLIKQNASIICPSTYCMDKASHLTAFLWAITLCKIFWPAFFSGASVITELNYWTGLLDSNFMYVNAL